MANLKDKVAEVARRIGADPEDLWQVIQYESSGKANAVGPKPKSGKPGVGLIQFMESTAKALGTTRDDLLKMNAEDQLPYVEKYFQDVKRRHKLDRFNLRQLYASVMAGTPHAGLDWGDGYHTIGEAVKTMEARKKAEGTDKNPDPTEDILGRLYGGADKPPEPSPYVPGHGPLTPEVAKREGQKVEQQQNPARPLRPWHERLTFDEKNIVEKTKDDAREMGMNVGDAAKEPQEDPTIHDKAAWEFLNPGEPMPEGWSVEGEIRKKMGEIQESRKKDAGEMKPRKRLLTPESVGLDMSPGWQQRYLGMGDR